MIWALWYFSMLLDWYVSKLDEEVCLNVNSIVVTTFEILENFLRFQPKGRSELVHVA